MAAARSLSSSRRYPRLEQWSAWQCDAVGRDPKNRGSIGELSAGSVPTGGPSFLSWFANISRRALTTRLLSKRAQRSPALLPSTPEVCQDCSRSLLLCTTPDRTIPQRIVGSLGNQPANPDARLLRPCRRLHPEARKRESCSGFRSRAPLVVDRRPHRALRPGSFRACDEVAGRNRIS